MVKISKFQLHGWFGEHVPTKLFFFCKEVVLFGAPFKSERNWCFVFQGKVLKGMEKRGSIRCSLDILNYKENMRQCLRRSLGN